MAGVQSKEHSFTKGSVVNLKELSVEDLKRLIAYQQREIAVRNDRLRGVEKLTTICSDLEKKLQSSQTRADNYETALRRAEARVAYLNKKLGIGPQSSFDIDVINPGVSRKDFDAVTRENIRLKEALEHIVPTELGGKDKVVKNKELYELVTTLQDDLARREHHIKELEETLNCTNKDDLVVKVNELTKSNMKLQRSMQAKQVFSEKLLKENRKLNEIIDQKRINQHLGQDIPDGHAAEDSTTRNDISNEEREKLLKTIEEKYKQFAELEASVHQLKEALKRLEKRGSELTTELALISEKKEKTEKELSETAKKCADFQKKCAGFFNQVVSLNTKHLESEEEISSFKRTVETLRAQVAEKDVMMVMMRDALSTHESDFRREHEERVSFQKKAESSQQESERLKRENQSHMATIRHFESEIERMSKLLMDPSKKLSTHECDFRREPEESVGFQKKAESSQQESERLKRENQSHMATIRHFESELLQIERMSNLLTDQKKPPNPTSFPVHGSGQPFGSSSSRGFFNLPIQEKGTPIEPEKDKDRIAAEEDHAGIKAEAMKKGSWQSKTYTNCQFHHCHLY